MKLGPGDVILTAGLPAPAAPQDPRKAALREVRRVLRDPASTDEQVDDALEALIELTKE